MKSHRKTACALLLSLITVSANADYTVNRGAIRTWRPQDVTITISQDPVEHTEQVCLALTLAQFLRDSNPHANVTVFMRNDGVALADYDTVDDVSEMCQTPQGSVTLRENLEAFIAGNNNNLVNCPICWMSRFGQAAVPDYGVLDPEAIPEVLLGADKVIDF